MNLRDRLNAIHGRPQRPSPGAVPAAPRVCWQKAALRPMEEFPGALQLRSDTVSLMVADPLPDGLDPRRILYLDTETTGLAGGAGTVAFEIGLGFLTDAGFVVRQLVMRDYPEEPDLLREVQQATAGFDALCTFNGRTFDLPLLRDRFLMNRMRPDCLDMPHIDLLHIARRVFRLRLNRCNLTRLEELVLGLPRMDDLPGSEAPKRYFEYLKTGQFSLLEDVLRHNEQDVASMCILLSRMAWLYEHPEAIDFSEDVYSIGVALERYHHVEEARRCFRLVSSGKLRAQGQLRLASSYRRTGEQTEAVEIWQRMIERGEGGVQPYVELAKHYEHVERNLPAALETTRRAMLRLSEPALRKDSTVQAAQNALKYRYDRLRRRLSQKGP